MDWTLFKDECLDTKCGAIYITTKGRILFQCTLCEESYSSFDYYQNHLSDSHLWTNLKMYGEDENVTGTEETETVLHIEVNNSDERKLGAIHSVQQELDENYDQESDLEDFASISDESTNNPSPFLKPFCEENLLKEEAVDILEDDYGANSTAIHSSGVRKIVQRKVIIGRSTPVEDRKHICTICGFGFKERGNLNHHLKRHSNARDFACPYCEKRFYTSTELKTHIKSHTQERPYLCTQCGETYPTRSRLNVHLKRHRGQKDYHCKHTGCKKSFYNSQYLKNHMLSHTNERKLKCSICYAAFKQKTALANHLKLHANKKEYKCKICDSEFNQMAGLYSHMKTMHK